MPPDISDASIATWAAPLPHPSVVQVRCSTWASIVSWRTIISTPHTRRYWPTIPCLLSSRSPRTFQLMHFIGVRTHLRVQPPYPAQPPKQTTTQPSPEWTFGAPTPPKTVIAQWVSRPKSPEIPMRPEVEWRPAHGSVGSPTDAQPASKTNSCPLRESQIVVGDVSGNST